MATPVACCGMECGVLTAGSTSNHWTQASSAADPTFDTTTFRSGLRSLRFNPSNQTSFTYFMAGLTNTMIVQRFYIRFSSLPNIDVFLCGSRASATIFGGACFKASDSKIYAGGLNTAAFTLGASGVTITTGIWYRIDIKVDSSANPWLIDVQVDGIGCGQASFTNASVSCNIGAGYGGANWTGDFYIEDLLVSHTSADYPLGPGYVISYIPNADGTHNVAGAADFKHGTGTTPAGIDITNASTDAWQDIDKRPLVISAAGAETLINLIAPPNATDYVEVQFEDSVEPSPPRAVEVIIGINQAGTGNGNMEVRLNDNGTEGTIYTATGVAGVAIATGVVFKRAHFADPPSAASLWVLGGLGNGDFNNLRIRFGSPATVDANPDQYLVEVMFEAEYQPALPEALFGRPFGQPGVKLMPQLLAT